MLDRFLSIFVRTKRQESKSMKKNIYNEQAIQTLIDKYDFTRDYITKCLRGTRTGVMPTKVKQDYEEIEQATKKQASETLQKIA